MLLILLTVFVVVLLIFLHISKWHVNMLFLFFHFKLSIDFF